MKCCICDHTGRCLGCQIFNLVGESYGHRGTVWLDTVFRAAESAGPVEVDRELVDRPNSSLVDDEL